MQSCLLLQLTRVAALAGALLTVAPLRALPKDPGTVLGRLGNGETFTVGAFNAAAEDGADYTDAVFWSHPPHGDLRNANFRGKILREANLCGTDCRQANFRGVDLRTTALDGALLVGADFTSAKLLLADAGKPHFHGVNLAGALWFRTDTDLEPVPGPGQEGPLAMPPDLDPDAEDQPAPPAPAPVAAPARRAAALQAKWETRFQELKAFAEENQHVRVPKAFQAGGILLAEWAKRQKIGRGSLTEAQRQALEALPGWRWGQAGLRWGDYLARLKDYVKTFGTAQVPGDYRTADGVELGAWVDQQRARHRQRDKPMGVNKTKALEKLKGWVWELEGKGAAPEMEDEDAMDLDADEAEADPDLDAKAPAAQAAIAQVPAPHQPPAGAGAPPPPAAPAMDVHAAVWRRHFQDLKAYADRHGLGSMPRGYQAGGINLYAWAVRQRGDLDKLSDAQRRDLESLRGWRGKAPARLTWKEYLERFKTYVNDQGTVRILRRYQTADGVKLGEWVSGQRRRRKTGDKALTSQRIKALEEIPGWTWENRNPNEGEAEEPEAAAEDADGMDQGDDPSAPAAAHSDAGAGAAPAPPASKNDRLWQQHFQDLKALVEKDGMKGLRRGLKVGGFDLYQWVVKQKQQLAKLSAERRQALDSLPGWQWLAKLPGSNRPKSLPWEDELKALQDYATEFGHAKVPLSYRTAGGFRLGAWVSRQRVAYGKKTMAPARIKALEAVPGWVWVAKAPAAGAAQPAAGKRKRKPAEPAEAPDPVAVAEDAERPASKRARKSKARSGPAAAPAAGAAAGSVDRAETPAAPALLASVPWSFLVRQLEDHARDHGTADPGPDYETEDGFPLGHWLHRQLERFRAKDPSLDPQCVAALRALPGLRW